MSLIDNHLHFCNDLRTNLWSTQIGERLEDKEVEAFMKECCDAEDEEGNIPYKRTCLLWNGNYFPFNSFGHTLQTLPNITRRLSDSFKIKFHTSDTNWSKTQLATLFILAWLPCPRRVSTNQRVELVGATSYSVVYRQLWRLFDWLQHLPVMAIGDIAPSLPVLSSVIVTSFTYLFTAMITRLMAGPYPEVAETPKKKYV